MIIDRNDVNSQVEMIWDSTLSLPVQPLEQVPSTKPGSIVGHIRITGAWQGAVTLVCDEQLARLAAASMFGLSDHELTAEHILDAIGELTNMAGGNLKALLPGPCQLSIPQTTVPKEQVAVSKHTDCAAGFQSDGLPLVLSVTEECSTTS